MILLAIDPGPTESGWVELDGDHIRAAGIDPNDQMLDRIHWFSHRDLVLELFEPYGMATGRSTIQSIYWSGRFWQAHLDNSSVPSFARVHTIPRVDVKKHICHSGAAKDTNIRRALLDMFPATGGGKTPQVGTKAQPGPLYGFADDMWAALALAITARDTKEI